MTIKLFYNKIIFTLYEGRSIKTDKNVELLAEKFMLALELMMDYRNKYFKSAKLSVLRKDVSDRQFTILCALQYGKKNTVSELAKMLQISKSTLSIIMGKMIKKGYLLKTHPQDDEDKRKIYFSVSESGKKILDEVQKSNLNEMKYLYSKMNEEQRKNMKKAYELLLDVLVDKDKELLSVINMGVDDDDIYVQNLFIITLLKRTNNILKTNLDDLKDEISLTRNQCHLLVSIEKHKYNTISKLEKFLNSSGSTVSITVSKLVKGGYLMKEYPSGDEDGRIVYIKVTPKGKEILKKMNEIMKKILIEFVSTYDVISREKIDKGLNVMISALQE